MRSCLATVCLLLVLTACAAAAESTAPTVTPAFDPAAADTIRTNLWVARALFTDIAREVVAAVPERDQGVSLRPRGTHDALPLLETALYAALLNAGHRPYLDESDDSGADTPIKPMAADYEIRFQFETCQLDYPAVGRRFGLWRNWIDREVDVSTLIGVVELSTGRLLLDDRIERRFNDRVPADRRPHGPGGHLLHEYRQLIVAPIPYRRRRCALRVRSRAQRFGGPLLAACLLLAVGLVGCGAHNPHPPGSYERAAAYREHGKHREAVDAYAAFLRRSPTDSLAAQAQFEKALSYIAEKEYPLAAVELQILRQEYPTNPLVEQAVFEEARAYVLQVGRTERDITPAYDARLRFDAFINAYPASSLAPEAQRYLVEISDLIVRKRLDQLAVYERLRRREAVAITLDRLIEEETASGLRAGVMLRRARQALDMDDPAAARELCGRIVSEYPLTDEARRASDLLADLPSASGP